MITVFKGDDRVEFISYEGSSLDGFIIDFGENVVDEEKIAFPVKDQKKLLKWLITHMD